jgi:16S rRNA processing protein RimM
VYNFNENEVAMMNYQIIGKITGLKGLKGELKIKPLSGFMKERLQKGSKIYMLINDQYKMYTVKEYNENQKTPLLVIKDHEHIDLVESFKHMDFYVDAEEDLILEDNAFHEDELLGLKVYQNKQFKGLVVDIRNYPKDDYLVVEKDDKQYLIPFRDEFIESMDDQRIDVVEMEGLF